MHLSTIVEHDQSGLEMVSNALDELTREGFIDGIRCRIHDAYEIEQVAEMVRSYQARVNIEHRALVKFRVEFIRSYATNNNKCYETAEVLFRKIASTIAGLKKLFEKFSPIDRGQLPPGVEAPSVFEQSALVRGDTQLDLFGMETFPRAVQDLYTEIDTLCTSSSMALLLCQTIIEDEEKMRNDPVQLKFIWEESCRELSGTIRSIVQYTAITNTVEKNEMVRRYENATSMNSFLQKEYHMHDKKALINYLVYEEVQNAQNQGLTKEEKFFFKDDVEKALRVRAVIKYFHLIIGVEGQKGKLSGKVIVEFLKWCGVVQSQEKPLYERYFIPTYLATHPKDALKVIGWSTIDTDRKLLRGSFTDEQLVSNFEGRLSDIPFNVHQLPDTAVELAKPA